jgi:dolichol-phosphate mannosyltransferase
LTRVVVLVPTYNERENLPLITARVRRAVPAVDLLVLDDASPDGTGDVADELAESDAQVQVLHRQGKEGLGRAYLAGFAWAQDRGYDAVVELDADGSHRPEDLPRLLAAAADADVVIGSRWVRGGSVVNWPFHRKLISLAGNAYTQVMLGIRVKDATGGFRVYRTSVLEQLDLHTVDSVGYGFQVDMTWRAVSRGLTVVEVPIEFHEREIGVSKMSRAIVVEAMLSVTRWGAAHRWQQLRRLGSPRRASAVEGARSSSYASD